MARSLTEVQTWLDRQKGEAGMVIEEFKGRLETHPHSAMTHSLSTFKAASLLALCNYYQQVIISDLETKTREDVVRLVRFTVEKEMLEISLNVASSPFMGTAELSRRTYLEALASLKDFLGEAAPQPLKPSPSLTPDSSVKELEIAASAFLAGDLSKEGLTLGIESLTFLLENTEEG